MTPGQKVSSVEIVKDHWGADAPAWIFSLARECDRTSQAKAAEKIGRSAASVCQILRNKYNADLTIIKERCEAALTSAVECPVMGMISGSKCLSTQELPFKPYNHVLVRQFKACRNCPHLIKKESKRDDA